MLSFSTLPSVATEVMNQNSEFYIHFETGKSANIQLFFLL